MFTDFVFPDNNEIEFIAIASKLGYGALYFIYGLQKAEGKEKLIEKLQKETKIKLNIAVLTDLNNINKAKKISRLVLVKSSENNRALFENAKNAIVYGLESDPRRDYIHHRASGLNQILCALAKKNNIKIGLSFSLLLNAQKRPQVMGRLKQNMKLCKKYNVEAIAASFAESPYRMRSPADLEILFKIL